MAVSRRQQQTWEGWPVVKTREPALARWEYGFAIGEVLAVAAIVVIAYWIGLGRVW